MARIARRIAGIGASDLADATAFDVYIGPAREITVDQQRGIIALHDGVTPGGQQFFAGGTLPDGSIAEPKLNTALAAKVNGALQETNLRITPEMYGAVGNDVVDDTIALQAAIDASVLTNTELNLGKFGRVYRITGTINVPDYARIVTEGAKVHYAKKTGTAFHVQGSNWKMAFELYSDAAQTISSITQANPAVVTVAGHGLTTGTEVMFRNLQGMTELNQKKYTITVIDANSFSLDGLNSTAFGAYTGGGHVMGYVSNHRGIFGQRTTFSPTNVVWIEDVDVSGMVIHGFGDSGLRLDWVRRFRFDDILIYNCSYAGMLCLSAIEGRASGEVRIRDIGPGSGNTMYPMSFSRSYSSPALSITDAPRSQDIHIESLFVSNCPYYVAFDTHGGFGISIGHLKTRNVMMPVNLEHATGGGSTVTVNNFTLGTFDLIGVDPATHNVGPAFAIDAQSGIGENANGISLGRGVVRKFGHQSDFGSPIFLNGAVVYINNASGVTIDDIQFYDCRKQCFRTVGVVRGLNVGRIYVDSLVEVEGTQSIFQFSSATTHGVVGDVTMRGAGNVFDTSLTAFNTGYGVSFGNTALLDGANLMTLFAKFCMKWGSGIMAARVMVQWDNTGAIVWDGFQELGAAVTITRNAVGDHTINLPAGMFNNLRVAALPGAQGAHKIVVLDASSSVVRVQTYDAAGALTDYPDCWLLVWGR